MNRIFQYPITETEAGVTIEHFLRAHGYSRHILIHLKKTHEGIKRNDLWARTCDVLHRGDILQITILEEASSENIIPVAMDLDIVYEDEDIMVLNKPADMPIHPSQNNYDNTLANGVAAYFAAKNQPFVYRCINRLDRDTTGLLILAKHMLSSAILSQMMVNREIHRTYRAIVEGCPVPAAGVIDAPIGRVEGSAIERGVDFTHGERAVTHYRVLASNNELSLMELQLETGRTHQIRVHMKYLGHPLIGDYLYYPDFARISRQALHSYGLEFQHPITKNPLHFTCPLPADMADIMVL
ncbi:MAG: RluA family pseudouridine synthase [Lachnospiraceae bacterium]|nr:RluA family pseudouridine synthase [Lachnospiraceae bacterium]